MQNLQLYKQGCFLIAHLCVLSIYAKLIHTVQLMISLLYDNTLRRAKANYFLKRAF